MCLLPFYPDRWNGEIILMSHPDLIERADRIEIRSPMRIGMRASRRARLLSAARSVLTLPMLNGIIR